VLNIIATWIFPLAIVLSLPYESLHRSRFAKTLISIINWLGSPQTALTATMFNFQQIGEAFRRAQERSSESNVKYWTDLYYVLSCFNQFDLEQTKDARKVFFQTLVYGLYHPVTGDSREEGVLLTGDLLSAIAHQLRMLRRRAVLPTIASLGTFLVAFVFSVVLSFAEVGEFAGVDPLVIGLLYTWLPVLVMYTIVDRNPISSERTA
jgi:hypothetical protein